MTGNKNGYFAKHAKSGAVLVSLGIHAVNLKKTGMSRSE
jgi:hypothetical protein